MFNTDLLFHIELGYMIDCAEMITKSAIERKESRGAHTRLDYPNRDDENWLKHIVLTKQPDGSEKMSYLPVTITRVPAAGAQVLGGSTTHEGQAQGQADEPRERRRPATASTRSTRAENVTLLDALIQVREYEDGTLALRCSCRSAICGSCSMRVDDRARLACRAKVIALTRRRREPRDQRSSRWATCR